LDKKNLPSGQQQRGKKIEPRGILQANRRIDRGKKGKKMGGRNNFIIIKLIDYHFPEW